MNNLLIVLFVNTFFSAYALSNNINEEIGEALFLTDYIKNGLIEEGRKKAIVIHPEMSNRISYSGYITVNKITNSNIFFWYFPSESNPAEDPLLTCTSGEPVQSCLFGLFEQFGPFIVTKNQNLKPRKHTLTANHNVVFIDIPVGVGFSFTDSDKGYFRTFSDLGNNYYSFVVQFLKLFPELQRNDFYASTNSQGSKHVFTLANAIKNNYNEENIKINLKGLIIGGGGLYDHKYQFKRADHLYQVGLLDFNGRNLVASIENVADTLRANKSVIDPHMVANLNSLAAILELTTRDETIRNLTGYENIYENILQPKSPDWYHFEKWIQRNDVRKAIHVGNNNYNRVPGYVVQAFSSVLLTPLTSILRGVLDDNKIKVLVYKGQLDMISSFAQLQNYFLNLDWSGSYDYKTADRKKWMVNGELAGYWKIARNLNEVLVRKAGHAVAAYQPYWVLKMITSFTRGTVLESLLSTIVKT